MNQSLASEIAATPLIIDQNVLIGCIVAITGNILISASFQVQKMVHKSNTDGRSYLTIPAWWCGLLIMATGEVGNFLAYGWAPTTLVAPLGAVSVISNCLLSRIVLKEPLTERGIAGVMLAVIGSGLVAYGCPVAAPVSNFVSNDGVNSSFKNVTAVSLAMQAPTGDIVYDSLVSWRALGYLLTDAIAAMIIANPRGWRWAVSEDQRKSNVVLCVLVCGLLGAFTVMSAKGVSIALSSLAGGRADKFTNSRSWLTYVLVLSAVGSIVLQMKYLNQAMIYFGAQEVVPIYYVIFTLVGISAGMAVYLEIDFGTWWEGALFGIGVLFTFIGVWLIHWSSTYVPARIQTIEVGKSEDNEAHEGCIHSVNDEESMMHGPEQDCSTGWVGFNDGNSSPISLLGVLTNVTAADPGSEVQDTTQQLSRSGTLSRSASLQSAPASTTLLFRSGSRSSAVGAIQRTTSPIDAGHVECLDPEKGPPQTTLAGSHGTEKDQPPHSIWSPNPCGLVEIWQASLEILNHTRTSSNRRKDNHSPVSLEGTATNQTATSTLRSVGGLLEFLSLTQSSSGRAVQSPVETVRCQSTIKDDINEHEENCGPLGLADLEIRPQKLAYSDFVGSSQSPARPHFDKIEDNCSEETDGTAVTQASPRPRPSCCFDDKIRAWIWRQNHFDSMIAAEDGAIAETSKNLCFPSRNDNFGTQTGEDNQCSRARSDCRNSFSMDESDLSQWALSDDSASVEDSLFHNVPPRARTPK